MKKHLRKTILHWKLILIIRKSFILLKKFKKVKNIFIFIYFTITKQIILFTIEIGFNIYLIIHKIILKSSYVCLYKETRIVS